MKPLLSLLLGLSLSAATPAKTAILIGDSIAEGRQGTAGRLSAYDLSKPNVPGQLSYYLERIGGLKVTNQGISGQKVPQILARLDRDVWGTPGTYALGQVPNYTVPTIAQGTPDLVWVHVGVNDVIYGATPDQVEANLAQLVDALQSHGSVVVLDTIGQISLDTSNGNAVRSQYVKDINAWIKATYSGQPGILVEDYFTAFYGPNGGQVPPGVLSGDGLHPTELGYARWGSKVVNDLLASGWIQVQP